MKETAADALAFIDGGWPNVDSLHCYNMRWWRPGREMSGFEFQERRKFIPPLLQGRFLCLQTLKHFRLRVLQYRVVHVDQDFVEYQ